MVGTARKRSKYVDVAEVHMRPLQIHADTDLSGRTVLCLGGSKPAKDGYAKIYLQLQLERVDGRIEAP